MKKVLTLAFLLSIASCTTTKPNHERFCIVVNDVKYSRHNRSLIRPKCQVPHTHNKKCQHHMYWFRYPTVNIHPGDTVDVSLSDIASPAF